MLSLIFAILRALKSMHTLSWDQAELQNFAKTHIYHLTFTRSLLNSKLQSRGRTSNVTPSARCIRALHDFCCVFLRYEIFQIYPIFSSSVFARVLIVMKHAVLHQSQAIRDRKPRKFLNYFSSPTAWFQERRCVMIECAQDDLFLLPVALIHAFHTYAAVF